MIEAINIAVLLAALLGVTAVFTSLISYRFGAPLLLVFLLVGLAAGKDGLGLINFSDTGAGYFIGSLALAIILYDSGFATRLQTLKVAWAPALVLATIGVALTAGLVGAAAMYLLGLSVFEALLLGAVVSSTDAAAVFFLLRVGGVHLREKISATLEVESGSNDPMAVLLTITIIELLFADGVQSLDYATIALSFVQQMGLGLVLGLLGGFAIVEAVNRLNLEPSLVPILVLGMALILFSGTGLVDGSGYLAVYVAGLITGNRQMRHAASLRSYQQGTTWLCQIVMFLALGLLARPSTFNEIGLGALGVAAFLILIARPTAIILTTLFFGFSIREQTFIAWVGLRGAVSILLAILPVVHGLEAGEIIFNTAFIVVLTSLIVQGWSIAPMARWLGLVTPPRIGPLERMDLELPGRVNHEVVVYKVHPDSRAARGERVPRWARPSLIYRDGRSIRPHRIGALEAGDQVYILAPTKHVAALDALFTGILREEDDPTIYGDFLLTKDTTLGDLKKLYEIDFPGEEETMSVADILMRDLNNDTEPGDRMAYGDIDLIVRRLDDEGKIDQVGLALEHGYDKAPATRFIDRMKTRMKAAKRARHRKKQKTRPPENDGLVEAEKPET